jgi:hypothetical protein
LALAGDARRVVGLGLDALHDAVGAGIQLLEARGQERDPALPDRLLAFGGALGGDRVGQTAELDDDRRRDRVGASVAVAPPIGVVVGSRSRSSL